MLSHTPDIHGVTGWRHRLEMHERTLKRAAFTSLFAGAMALSWGQARHVAFAQDKPVIGSPRDGQGRLQPFGCTLASPGHFLPPLGAKRHMCDPLSFAGFLKSAKTVAVTVGNIPAEEDTQRERDRVRTHAEDLLRKWGRFKIVTDPDSADFVFQFHKYEMRTRYDPNERIPVPLDEPLAGSIVYVWPRGTDPEKDDLIWMEIYCAKWPRGDSVAGVLRLLRRDIEDAEKLQTKVLRQHSEGTAWGTKPTPARRLP